jgi:FSR family fosmidomycin resistance protein-like MFS transporter
MVHGLVDLSCAFLIFRDVATLDMERGTMVLLFLLYNVVAFAGQAPAGLLADRLTWYGPLAALGVAMAALALFIGTKHIIVAIVVIATGNALFHVGAGAQVLQSSGGRSTESGVFVGPGAVGLFVGAWLAGQSGLPNRWIIAGALLLSVPFLLYLSRRLSRRQGDVESLPSPPLPSKALTLALLCAILLLGSVTVRALVGGAVAGSWRGVDTTVLMGLAMAACCGKMLGGFFSDRLGWARTSVTALLLSLPLVTYLVLEPVAAIAGMLIFQMTMPVTLKAVHHLMPERPGLSFGLPCVALIVGSLPGVAGYRFFALVADESQLGSAFFSALAVGLSALLIASALRLLRRIGRASGPAATAVGFDQAETAR